MNYQDRVIQNAFEGIILWKKLKRLYPLEAKKLQNDSPVFQNLIKLWKNTEKKVSEEFSKKPQRRRK